ncbi:MFS transporter [Alistipes timonensis]
MKRNLYCWLIVLLVMVATALSFMDRQVLSISILKIREELGITEVEYGFINSGFLISYTLMFTLGGIFVDRFGSRRGLGYSVGFWSLTTALHALATKALHFGFFRFLLGIGEGGCFPGAVKVVQEWVPKERQAVANGLAIGGSAIGSVIALPMCALLLQYAGWRSIFIGCGLIGMIWFTVWWVMTGSKKYARYGMGTPPPSGSERTRFDWKSLGRAMKSKEARVFIVMRFLLDPIFYFYMFWIPKYLSDERGMSIGDIGYTTWIPFVALGIANVVGGYVSDAVYTKTGRLDFSRKIVMGCAAALTLPVLFISVYRSIPLVIAVMSLAFFAHGLWITNYITSIGDTFGKTATSTIVGLSGSAGAVSSLIVNPLVGYCVAYSYDMLWIYAGSMYPVAFVIFLCFMPRLQLKTE